MNATSRNENPIRHGDVVLWPIDPVDVTKMTEVKRDPKASFVLTTGSATGHEHVLEGGAASIYEDGPDARILVLREPGALVHAGGAPRHAPIELTPGTYRQSIKRQADGEGWSPVED